MIEVKQATEIVLNHPAILPKKEVPLSEGLGYVLVNELVADRDFPPFNRVTMDGIAINVDQFNQGTRSFKISGIQPAGSPQQTLTEEVNCIEVMTGAVLPIGTNAVIRYEDLEIKDGVAKVVIDQVNWGQNIHKKGEDRQQGVSIVSKNTLLSSPELAVAATVGQSTLSVMSPPKVVIVSTGDELVKIHETPLLHQIRSSNVHQLKAAMTKWNIVADLLHLVDDQEATVQALGQCIADYDVVMLSGGVSKGKFDYVPGALEVLGVEKLFHRVRQRPGKPFWFGHIKDKVTVFALPGNPVSSFMCFNRYFIPWLRKSLELSPFNSQFAVLAEDIHFKPDLTYLAQVKITSSPTGQLLAYPIEGHGSGDLANLVDSNAFIELPRGLNLYPKGTIYPIHSFK